MMLYERHSMGANWFIFSCIPQGEHLQPLIKYIHCHKSHFCMCKKAVTCLLLCSQVFAQQHKVLTHICSGRGKKTQNQNKPGSTSNGKLDLSLFPMPQPQREENTKKEKPKRDINREHKPEHFCSSLIACGFQDLGQKFGF